MPTILKTIILLSISNMFMTFTWYAYLKNLSNKPWIIAALVSCEIASIEYFFMVPVNRIGYTALSLSQLKILQEVITLSVFVPFAFFIFTSRLSLIFYGQACVCWARSIFMFRT